MKTWLITLTHIDIPLLTASLERVYQTTNHHEFEAHVLVDHHWPIAPWIHRRELLGLAEKFDCKLITPYENMGGARGINWALSQIPASDEDIFIGIDGDSFPRTELWVSAMKNVLKSPKYAAVSLKINADLYTKEWEYDFIENGFGGGEHVMRPAFNGIEMINVTGWKVGEFRRVGGFEGLPFYGGVEIPIFTKLRANGFLHGYLRHYSEDMKPFEAHPEYVKWKQAHVAGNFPGNFCEWVDKFQVVA